MPEIGGKKLPKWAIPVGIVAVVGGVIYIRRHKKAETSATEPGSEGLTNQSFIPVTGESPPPVGGTGSIGSAGGGSESNAALLELIKSEREGREHYETKQEGIVNKLIESLTGGGAPHSGGQEGVVPVPPPPHVEPVPIPPPPQPNPPQPKPQPPQPKIKARCPGPKGFPFEGPHGCWHWSRETHNGCPCHGYENGMLECQHKVRGTCSF